MSRAAVKLFRETQVAENAVKELRAKGYRPEEISIVLREQGDAKKFANLSELSVKMASLPDVGPVIATGPAGPVLTDASDPVTALAELWGVSKEKINYYQLGISVGSIVVSVQADDARVAKARQILRAVEAASERVPALSSSPGFSTAGRMTETNPVDEKMTGDFRKY